MGWILNKFAAWGVRQQEKELRKFIAILSSMDGSELGLVVAMSTDARNLYASAGKNFLEPLLLGTQDPMFTFKLVGDIKKLQKQNNPSGAASLMIWAHTMRASTSLELRPLGRQMWKELQRGFPHAEMASYEHRLLTGMALNIDGYNQFPSGLTPLPLP